MCNLSDLIEEDALKNAAARFFENGASYELVRASIPVLTDEELQEIYTQAHKASPNPTIRLT